jgi:hypothetical protein
VTHSKFIKKLTTSNRFCMTLYLTYNFRYLLIIIKNRKIFFSLQIKKFTYHILLYFKSHNLLVNINNKIVNKNMNVSTLSDFSNPSIYKKNIPLRFWFLGDHGVGKSSFIYKFVLETIPKNILPTIGKITLLY